MATSNPEEYPNPARGALMTSRGRVSAGRLSDSRIAGNREAMLQKYAARLLCRVGRNGRLVMYIPAKRKNARENRKPNLLFFRGSRREKPSIASRLAIAASQKTIAW